MHPAHGVPEVISARGMFLTPPAPSEEAEAIVRNFLLATAPLYGLSQGEVGALQTTANYANPAGNLRWVTRSEEHTSELQSRLHLVCRLLLEKKKKQAARHSCRD